MAYLIPEEMFAPLTGQSTRKYISFGDGKDKDDAFDSAARNAQGLNPTDPRAWLEHASSADMTQEQETAVSLDEALSIAAAYLQDADLASESGIMIPVAATGCHVRVKERVLLDSVELMMPQPPTILLPGDPRHLEAFKALLQISSMGTDDALRIDVTAVSRRFRAKATPNRSAGAAAYAIIDGDRIIARGFRTATEAKADAIARIRALDTKSAKQPNYDVVKIAQRDIGPFIEVRRDMVAQKTRAIIHHISRKDNPLKTAGWLIAGRA